MNNMLWHVAFLLSISSWIFSGLVAGKAGAAQEEVPYFTNDDIEKYRQPSDDSNSAAKPTGTGTKRASSAQLEKQKEGASWCKKATSYRKVIEKDQEDISDLEKALEELSGAESKKKKNIEKRLGKAKKHLRNSERELAELDDEAYRKGVPPGWLRCQFE